jgi:hypothetical protein
MKPLAQSRSSHPLRIAAASAALVGACCLTAAAQNQPARRAPTSGEVFKNIKVLKDLPADQMIPVMHNVSISLGVQCTFCHVVETDAQGQHTGFEKDTKKEKEVARAMITMTNDLNAHQRILDRKATCFMCHHGHAEPQVRAPIPPAPGAATPPGESKP